jgi:hypothetical protein
MDKPVGLILPTVYATVQALHASKTSEKHDGIFPANMFSTSETSMFHQSLRLLTRNDIIFVSPSLLLSRSQKIFSQSEIIKCCLYCYRYQLHCLTKLRIVVTVIVRYVFSLGPQFDII